MKTFSNEVIMGARTIMLKHCKEGKELSLSKFDKELEEAGFNTAVLNLYDLIKSGDLNQAGVKFGRTGEKFWIKNG